MILVSFEIWYEKFLFWDWGFPFRSGEGVIILFSYNSIYNWIFNRFLRLLDFQGSPPHQSQMRNLKPFAQKSPRNLQTKISDCASACQNPPLASQAKKSLLTDNFINNPNFTKQHFSCFQVNIMQSTIYAQKRSDAIDGRLNWCTCNGTNFHLRCSICFSILTVIIISFEILSE